MASIRRNTLGVQRGVAVQNGEALLDADLSTKLSHSETYLNSTRLLKSLLKSLVNTIMGGLAGLLLRPTARFVERSRSNKLRWNKVFFHVTMFFVAGLLIGFTPFVFVDIPKSFSSGHKELSFLEDPAVIDTTKKFDLLQKEDKGNENVEVKYDTNPHSWTVKNESHDIENVPSRTMDSSMESRKLLIIVTPTHVRPFQAYHLTRLAHTLRNVPPPLLWLVVEMFATSSETAKLLRGSGIMYRHLVCKQNVTSIKDATLNTALSHIEEHRLDGIVHFADDNGIYSIQLFDQMRHIRRLGTWPVAILTGAKKEVSIQGPVCNGSQVIGWHRNKGRTTRSFHTAMAGFAFNSTVLWEPNRWLRLNPAPKRKHDSIEEDSEETAFLEELFEDEAQMQGLANNCSSIMAWRLEKEAPELIYPNGWMMPKNLDVVAPLA